MKDELHFSIEREHYVNFLLGDNEFHGRIVFNINSPAHLEIYMCDLFTSLRNDTHELVICKTDNNEFHLIDCKQFGSKIYPKLIILNPPHGISSFSEFEVSINELNIILHDSFSINRIENNQFITKTNESNFDINISTSNNIVKISDCWHGWSNISHNDDVVTTFTQRHIIHVINKKPLNLEDIKKESLHIVLTFSLLTLIQLHLNYVWVIHEGKRYPVYFPTLQTNKKEKIDWTKSLVNLKNLTSVQWDTIFNHSYNNESFNELWSRFYGMLSYDSYWEYEFLGYMSILDFYLKGTGKHKKMTFLNRFHKKQSGLSCDIKNYINISDEIIKELIKLRNGVAHCDPTKLDISDDISNFMVYKNRLLVLLNYFILHDLGLSDKEYAVHTSNSFNSIKMGARLQRKWLNKIIGDTAIIYVSKQDFELIKKHEPQIDDTIIVEEENQKHTFNKTLSERLREDRYKKGSQYENICQFIDQNLIPDYNNSLHSERISTLHIHTLGEGNFLELISVYILKRTSSDNESVTI